MGIINVLLVEDNPGDARLVREMLAESGVPFQLTLAENLADGIRQARGNNIHVVLLDLSLPDSLGLNTVVSMHTQAPRVPIVVLTGTEDEALGIQLVHAGAQDYLVKRQITGYLLVRSQLYAIERQRTEEKLKEQATLLDITPNAITVLDQEGRVLYWNKGAEKLYGWTAEEVFHKKVDELLYIDTQRDALIKAREQGLAEGEWAGELEQTDRHERPVVVESRWLLVRDDSLKPKAFLVSDTDITARKKAEEELKRIHEELIRNERLAAVGEIVMTYTHLLANAVTPIKGFGGMLLQKYPQDVPEYEWIKSIVNKADEIMEVLNKMRTLEQYKTTTLGGVTILDISQGKGSEEVK